PAATAVPRGQPYFAPGGLDAISSASMAVLAMGGASTGASQSGRGGLHPVRDGYTLTADVNLVQGGFSVRYRIVDPLAWVKAGTAQTIDALIEGSCYHAATTALAVTKIDDALGARLSSLREEVRTAAQKRIDELALGVELVAVEVQQWVPPAAVLGAFNEVTSAQVEARTAVEQARTYRAQLLPKAESDAYRVRQQAEADRTQWVARAQGETSAFLALLAEHRAAPDLVEPRLRAEALEEVLPRLKFKTILPADSGPVHLLLREGR
ncbi:MAG TPA: SPFH domain-containing protein, partial [Opitutaceae bacterium]|nr:SPFH domain-containing protein [Opitutaceae bacterium]